MLSTMIVTLASGKGGVGKSTSAALLTWAADRAGLTSTVLNLDPQRTLPTWLGERVTHMPTIERASQVQALDQSDRLLIVDTPPGTSPQAVAGWEAADVLIGCTGATTMDVEGLVDLAERLGGLSEIDLVAVCRFDSRANISHGVANLLRARWPASRLVIFPSRSEVPNAYDQRRPVALSSPLSIAADDLLARLLELDQATSLRRRPPTMAKHVRRDVVAAHDPIAARFDSTTETTTTSVAPTIAETIVTSASEAGETPPPKSSRSALTIDFDRSDYQRIKQAAKARGLTTTAFIRSCVLAAVNGQ